MGAHDFGWSVAFPPAISECKFYCKFSFFFTLLPPLLPFSPPPLSSLTPPLPLLSPPLPLLYPPLPPPLFSLLSSPRGSDNTSRQVPKDSLRLSFILK